MEESVRCHRLTTVLHAITSAPHMATKLLQQLQEDETTGSSSTQLTKNYFYLTNQTYAIH